MRGLAAAVETEAVAAAAAAAERVRVKRRATSADASQTVTATVTRLARERERERETASAREGAAARVRVAREAASARGSADRTGNVRRSTNVSKAEGLRDGFAGRRPGSGGAVFVTSGSREESRERRRAEVYAFNRLMCASELAATRAFMRGGPGFGAGPGGEEVAGRAGSWSDAESDVEDAAEPLPRHLRV